MVKANYIELNVYFYWTFRVSGFHSQIFMLCVVLKGKKSVGTGSKINMIKLTKTVNQILQIPRYTLIKIFN